MHSERDVRFSALRSHRVHGWILFGLCLVATAIYFIAAHQSRFDLNNIDGISYLSIAKQWAIGQYEYALNGYWSPMLSWLMVPFIWAGVDAIEALMFVNAIAATVATCVSTYFAWKHSKYNFIGALIVFIAVFSLSAAQISANGPDGLVVAWVVWFSWVLVELDQKLQPGSIKQRVFAGVILGLTGVAGYLTKQYLIPVFAVGLIAWFVIRIVADRDSYRGLARKEALARWPLTATATLVTIVIVAGPWVAALSQKYDGFTVGTSFSVNMERKFDPGFDERQRDPLQLVTPPNPSAVSYGEDRSEDTADGAFKSADSLPERAKFYLVQRVVALPYYLDRIATFAPFAFFTVLALMAAWILGWVRFSKSRAVILVGTLWSIYFLGYAAITQQSSGGGNSRYYWPLLPLAAIVAALLLRPLWRAVSRGKNVWKKALIGVLIAMIPLASLTQNAFGIPFPFSTTASSFGVDYIVAPPVVPEPLNLAEEIRTEAQVPTDSNIAGSNYRMTVQLAYFLEAHAFGRSGHHFDITNPAFRQVLADNDIDYFFQYTPVGTTPPDVSSFATVAAKITKTMSCSDEVGLAPVPCELYIIRLAG